MEATNQPILILVNNAMTLLDGLPQVESFLGMLDLKTGSMVISALCVLHPSIYGCTFFMPMSYLLLTIWFLLALFFFVSVLLFYGLTNNDVLLVGVWVWYSLLFVATMFLLMFLLGLFFISKEQKVKVAIVLLGILWYILTIYFILVVNSHRKALVMNKPSGGSSELQDSTGSQDEKNSNAKGSEDLVNSVKKPRNTSLQDETNSNKKVSEEQVNSVEKPRIPGSQDEKNSSMKDSLDKKKSEESRRIIGSQDETNSNTKGPGNPVNSVEIYRRLKALRKASGIDNHKP